MNLHPEELGGSVRIISVGTSASDTASKAVDEALLQLGRWGHCFVLAFLPESLDHTEVATGTAKNRCARQFFAVPVAVR